MLLPISVWVQKNSIKMIKMQPEINYMKAQFFGDKDQIAEKQAEIWITPPRRPAPRICSPWTAPSAAHWPRSGPPPESTRTAPVNKHIVFYSESGGFYKYYRGIIAYLLDNTNIVIHYITSDPEDKIFQLEKEKDHLRAYYIGERRLITMMMKMDADMVVMTMPDLNCFHIKRSYVRDDIEYIYIPHGMDSLNLTMRTGSMNHYDTVFCVGKHW